MGRGVAACLLRCLSGVVEGFTALCPSTMASLPACLTVSLPRSLCCPMLPSLPCLQLYLRKSFQAAQPAAAGSVAGGAVVDVVPEVGDKRPRGENCALALPS